MPCWTPPRLLGCPADYRSEHCLSWGVLRSTQARAELPAGSRWTIAASRIEAHRAGAVALPAVEHTDPDAVVGGPVRGGAAGYPHGRLQIVGELPVAGAFVARRLDCLCCDGGCRGHVDCPDPLLGRRLRADAAPQGRGEVEPAGSPLVVPRCAWSGRPGRSSHRVVRGRCGRPDSPGNTPDGRAPVAPRSGASGFRGAVPNQRHRRGGAVARVNGFDAHAVGHLLRVTYLPKSSSIGMLAVSRSACRPTGPDPGRARPLSPGQCTCDAHADTSTVTVVCTTPSLATDRRPTTCGQPPCGGGWPAPWRCPLSTAPTRDYGPAWTPELRHLLGSASAETVIADPVWPWLVAAIAACGWPPRDLLAAAAAHLRGIAEPNTYGPTNTRGCSPTASNRSPTTPPPST